MSLLLNLVLTFYPATLIWSSIPTDYLKKLDSFGAGTTGHFLVRAVIYLIIFAGCYFVVKRFTSSGFISGRPTSVILLVVSLLILASVVFFSILPGSTIYETPKLINQYIIQTPYAFIAVLIPLIVLFFS